MSLWLEKAGKQSLCIVIKDLRDLAFFGCGVMFPLFLILLLSAQLRVEKLHLGFLFFFFVCCALKGIYRVNGAKSRVEKLCQAFENGKHLVELSELYPHDISNVLKLYLRQVGWRDIEKMKGKYWFIFIFLCFLFFIDPARPYCLFCCIVCLCPAFTLQLPEPLILFRYYNDFIGLAKESQSIIVEDLEALRLNTNPVTPAQVSVDLNRVLFKMKDLLRHLPPAHYKTLQFLIEHLHRSVGRGGRTRNPIDLQGPDCFCNFSVLLSKSFAPATCSKCVCTSYPGEDEFYV